MANQKIDSTAYKRAVMHSRRVTFFKRFLPVVALSGFLIGGGVILAGSIAPDLSVDVIGSTISDGKLTMANPNLSGFTKSQKPYSVTANRAIQDLGGGSQIDLEMLRAEMEMDDGKKASLTSATGTFNSETSLLVLPQKAIVKRSDGLEVTMGAADINVDTGAVSARNKVRVINEKIDITSTQMQIVEGGKKFIFSKNVRVLLTPTPDDRVPTQTVAN